MDVVHKIFQEAQPLNIHFFCLIEAGTSTLLRGYDFPEHLTCRQFHNPHDLLFNFLANRLCPLKFFGFTQFPPFFAALAPQHFISGATTPPCPTMLCSPKVWPWLKPVARLVFQGWQNCTGAIMWYKIWELISYFMLLQSNGQCVCRKRLNFLVCHKDQGWAKLKFQERSLLIYKYKATKNCKKIPRGGKKLASCCLGVAFATSCHPMAKGLSWLCHCQEVS